VRDVGTLAIWKNGYQSVHAESHNNPQQFCGENRQVFNIVLELDILKHHACYTLPLKQVSSALDSPRFPASGA
jgi:hypothetical protein